MGDVITVRLRYTVTGSLAAAKQAIGQKFTDFLPGLQEFAGPDYNAKKFSVDVDPDEVSGYSNYPTFHVALFLSNNPPQYDQARALAKLALTKGVESTDPNAYSEGLVWLADELETLVEQGWLMLDAREEECKTDSDTLAHSLLTAALGRVNWRELAEEWITSVQEG